MKKFSTLFVALVFGFSSIGVASAQTAPPPPDVPVPVSGGEIAPVEGGVVIGGVGVPTAAVIAGGVLLAVGLGVAISNASSDEESTSSTPTSTSTSTSTR